jgi:hypothetical protein
MALHIISAIRVCFTIFYSLQKVAIDAYLFVLKVLMNEVKDPAHQTTYHLQQRDP